MTDKTREGVIDLSKVIEERKEKEKQEAKKRVLDAEMGDEPVFAKELRFETRNILAEFKEFSNEVAGWLEIFLADENSETYNDLYNYIQEKIFESISEVMDISVKDKERDEPDFTFPVQFIVPCDDEKLLERLQGLERKRFVIQKIGQLIFKWINLNFQPNKNKEDDFEYEFRPTLVKVVADSKRKYFAVKFDFNVNLFLGLNYDEEEASDEDPESTN
jgi:hypothetical protein